MSFGRSPSPSTKATIVHNRTSRSQSGPTLARIARAEDVDRPLIRANDGVREGGARPEARPAPAAGGRLDVQPPVAISRRFAVYARQALRVLGACLETAVRHGYAATNPVRVLPSSEKPRAERKEAAYFTNDELPRLFAELPMERDEACVMTSRRILTQSTSWKMSRRRLRTPSWTTPLSLPRRSSLSRTI